APERQQGVDVLQPELHRLDAGRAGVVLPADLEVAEAERGAEVRIARRVAARALPRGDGLLGATESHQRRAQRVLRGRVGRIVAERALQRGRGLVEALEALQ